AEGRASRAAPGPLARPIRRAGEARADYRRSLRGSSRRRASGAGSDIAAAVGVDEQRLAASLDDVAVDDDLLDAVETRQVEHRLEQDALHDRAQPARTGLALDRLLGDRLQRVVGQLEADVLHLEQPLVLLDQGVLRLGQDLDQ